MCACVCVCSTAVASLRSSLFLFFEEKFKRGNKVKDKKFVVVWGGQIISGSERNANPNGNPSLVCKKLFFPKENFNENGYRFMGYFTFVPLQFNSSYCHRYSVWVSLY